MKWLEILCEDESHEDSEIAKEMKDALLSSITFIRAASKGKHDGIELANIMATMQKRGFQINGIDALKNMINDIYAKTNGVTIEGDKLTFNKPPTADEMINQSTEKMNKQKIKNDALDGAASAIDGMV